MENEQKIPFAILLYEKACKRLSQQTKTNENILKYYYARALTDFFADGMYDEEAIKKVKTELAYYFRDEQEETKSTTLPPSSPQ